LDILKRPRARLILVIYINGSKLGNEVIFCLVYLETFLCCFKPVLSNRRAINFQWHSNLNVLNVQCVLEKLKSHAVFYLIMNQCCIINGVNVTIKTIRHKITGRNIAHQGEFLKLSRLCMNSWSKY
jgi:hypothetical protein